MTVRCYLSDDLEDLIIFEFLSEWTWAEFHKANADCRDWIDYAVKPVILLLNFESSKHLPPNSPREIRRIVRHQSNNIRLTLIVGVFPALAVVGHVMMRLFPKRAQRMRVFASLREAKDFLRTLQAASCPQA